jgi:hypothetical protein
LLGAPSGKQPIKKYKPKAQHVTEDDSTAEVYQFRVCLIGISPLIWRRLLVRSDSTLGDWHHSIQIVMNWSDYYLHRFMIYGKYYAVPRLHGAEADDARAVRLDQLKLNPNQHFLYEYSFFEWWAHEIRLEKKLAVNTGITYPTCMSGARAAPEEEWGGVEGFMERQQHFSEGYITRRLLQIYVHANSSHPPDDDERETYRAELEQLGYWMNAKQFNRQAVNRRLTWYAAGDERWREDVEIDED